MFGAKRKQQLSLFQCGVRGSAPTDVSSALSNLSSRANSPPPKQRRTFSRASAGVRQLGLDAGQSEQKRCPDCGMVWVPGTDDDRAHTVHCVLPPKITGWRQADVVAQDSGFSVLRLASGQPREGKGVPQWVAQVSHVLKRLGADSVNPQDDLYVVVAGSGAVAVLCATDPESAVGRWDGQRVGIEECAGTPTKNPPPEEAETPAGQVTAVAPEIKVGRVVVVITAISLHKSIRSDTARLRAAVGVAVAAARQCTVFGYNAAPHEVGAGLGTEDLVAAALRDSRAESRDDV